MNTFWEYLAACLINGLMIGAICSTIYDIERTRGKLPPPPDGLEPVNRRVVDMIARQL